MGDAKKAAYLGMPGYSHLSPGEYDGGWDPGVTRAVDEWVAAGAELVGRRGTVAVVRPPACPG